jgi:hypothetical protein
MGLADVIIIVEMSEERKCIPVLGFLETMGVR